MICADISYVSRYACPDEAQSHILHPHSCAGELDALISSIPHCHLVTAPVLGPPATAEVAALIICMSGEYRAKKELAHLLVPAVGRKVLDLGGNIEKGVLPSVRHCMNLLLIIVLQHLHTSSSATPLFLGPWRSLQKPSRWARSPMLGRIWSISSSKVRYMSFQ